MQEVRKGIQHQVFLGQAKDNPIAQIAKQKIEFEGHTYKINGLTLKDDLYLNPPPIGVIMGGGQAQFLAGREDGKQVYLLIYWYTKLEGGLSVILDAIQEIK